MDTKSLKTSVVDSYSKLATLSQKTAFSKLFACCDTGANPSLIGEKIGYSSEELEAVPEGSNLGVGCGNPSALAKIQKGETVIDLGSGAGFDAFLVSPIVGDSGKVIGIDLSEEMLELARKNSKQGQFANVEFLKGDIEALPLQEEIADHIISNCVINLSINKAEVYKEAYRVLKNGGKISISDIVLEKDLPDFIKNSQAAHIACIAGAEKLEDYLGYVRAAGFQDIRIEGKQSFPLEVMLLDPQLQQLARELNFDMNSQEVKELASRVSSISLSARK
ncbi:MAG: arsenite methyltransferase [Bacteroidia bacterium]|nr:arsenite methyltransferase [Bacteroidia bacterium]